MRVGDYDLSSDADIRIAAEYEIEEIFIHEDYTVGKYYNDIAILKTEGKIFYNGFTGPVCLPLKGGDDAEVGSLASVIGWGDTRFGMFEQLFS